MIHKDTHSGKLMPAIHPALIYQLSRAGKLVPTCLCCLAVAVLYPSGEHGKRGGSAEREALEDLQPVRDPGDGPRTRGRRQGEHNMHSDAALSNMTLW